MAELKEDDIDRRSEFCQICFEKVTNNPDLIDHIFCSDEVKFNLNRSVNRHNWKYLAQKNPHLRIKVPTSVEGVMVSLDLSFQRRRYRCIWQTNADRLCVTTIRTKKESTLNMTEQVPITHCLSDNRLMRSFQVVGFKVMARSIDQRVLRI